MEHFGNEPSVNVSYASFLCNFTISSSPQNKSEALAFCHLRPLTDWELFFSTISKISIAGGVVQTIVTEKSNT